MFDRDIMVLVLDYVCLDILSKKKMYVWI